MNRRTFLVGFGTVTVGTGAILASGSFSQAESQRNVTIETVGDEDAYLRLVYSDRTVDCEAEIELVELTNQLKERVDEIEVEITYADGLEFGDLVVPDELAVGESASVTLPVECAPGDDTTVTVEFDVRVRGADGTVDAQDRSIDVSCVCDDTPEFDAASISFVAFCADEPLPDGAAVSAIEFTDDGGPVTVEWDSDGTEINEIVLWTEQNTVRSFFTNGQTGGTMTTRDDDNVPDEYMTADESKDNDETDRNQSEPCAGGSTSSKFEWDDESGFNRDGEL